MELGILPRKTIVGVKFYVKDDLGNEYGPTRWTTRSDSKHFAGLVRSKELLRVIETHFGLDLDQLLRIECRDDVTAKEDLKWQWIDHVIRCIRDLVQFIEPDKRTENKGLFVSLNQTRMKMGIIPGAGLDFEEPYFTEDGFHQDLIDLMLLLYHIKHIGGEEVQFYTA